jgi:hypothetical protein
MSTDSTCELCEATPFTEWFHADDLCWIAECDACGVPMVVWRVHDPNPPEEVRRELHRRLGDVMSGPATDPQGTGEYWIDENMRSIPDHYHAHARRRIDWTRRS